jgi:nucleotide-binding universal stress UspA family protein
MLPLKNILHPSDFSDASAHALQLAIGLARDYHARLVLLHAVEPPVYYGEVGLSFIAPEEYQESARERIEALVGSDPKVVVESVVTEGMAASEILRVARERHCDLIVLGSHGRTGIGRVLMGSVAEEVARRSPCPVLIVRAPHEILLDNPAPAGAATS